MNSLVRKHHIFWAAALIALACVAVGAILRWPVVLLISEGAVAIFLGILALISKERHQNRVRRSARNRARSIYAEASSRPVVLPR